MRSFEYFRPTSLQEACTLVGRHGYDARVLAGGQSLLNMMKLRIASPKYLVDLAELPELLAIAVDSQKRLRIGAMVTYHQLATSGLATGPYLILKDVLSVIADEQIRHVGTLGGSCCQADPHGDTPNVVVALDADLEAISTKGKRTIPAGKFFTGMLETALGKDEILINIYLPPQPPRTGSAYEKFAWRKGDYAIISVATVVTIGTDGKCSRVKIVVGSARPTPVALQAATDALLGQPLDDDRIRAAAGLASQEVEPEPDPVYGPVEYKRELIRTLTERGLKRAAERATKPTD